MATAYETNQHYVNTEKKYASKGVGGTVLCLGIAGTALGLLNGGAGLFSGLMNNSSSNSNSSTAQQ